MATIEGVQIRKFSVGTHTMFVACLYLSDYSTGSITGGQAMDALEALSGLVVSGYSAIATTYSGYDAGISAFDVTEGNLRLVYTKNYNQYGTVQVCGPAVIYNGVSLCVNGGSWGYGGGNPWVEFSPLFAFVDSATNKLLQPTSGLFNNYYNNANNNIAVVSAGSTYTMLISSGLGRTGATEYGVSGFTPLSVNVDDISEETELNPDPYKPGGTTGDDDTDGEGGTGDFDGTSDPIDFPDLPTVSAVDTKFITIFNPTKAQLTSLAEYMWSPLFDIDTLKKLWANPMDCILGLTMVPFSVPNGGTSTVAIGNVSTGVSMTKAGSQYVAIDCGSINVKEFWGGYLDYDPYTKFQIYLPYVGIKPLLADEIMKKSIHVKYHCDILTGACNCFVKCGGSVLYSFNGQCSTQIPISGNDWRNTISAAINIAGQAAGMYMTGGATAPMAISSIAQSAVNGLKQTVEKSGSLSGTGGMLAIQKPYLIATRPKQAVPKNQNKFTGYPAFITRTLSSCKGYTEVYSCHLENIPCTADELNEIENLLKSGVIL